MDRDHGGVCVGVLHLRRQGGTTCRSMRERPLLLGSPSPADPGQPNMAGPLGRDRDMGVLAAMGQVAPLMFLVLPGSALYGRGLGLAEWIAAILWLRYLARSPVDWSDDER